MTAALSQLPWFVARGSGAVTLVLLTVSLVLGIPTLLSWGTPRAPRLIVQLLHRNVSLLVVVFLAVHVLSSVVDDYVHISITDAFVPFAGSYRPIWLGLGAIAADVLLALTVTSVLRRHIGLRTWKLVHLAAYACWPIAMLHGLGTGSDTRSWWMLGIDAVCAAAVTIAIVCRLAARPSRTRRWRITAAVCVVAVPILLTAFLLAGPLQPGWGKAAIAPAAFVGGTAP